ncbi:FG-GAP repeat domain-containing protein [Novosphingobium profundi]|uniref:FG-GAP repeat domain-containing protein n=1 Tax=Novosphingobium profundi TaxID=1774954 RepID=UPI001CFDB766|nr:VCBS repeat-containing protein [Novosphingobium profundi]
MPRTSPTPSRVLARVLMLASAPLALAAAPVSPPADAARAAEQVVEDFALTLELACPSGCAGGLWLEPVEPDAPAVHVSFADADRWAYRVDDPATGAQVPLGDAPNPFQDGAGIPRRAGQGGFTPVPASPPRGPLRVPEWDKASPGWHRIELRVRRDILALRFDDEPLRPYGLAMPAATGPVRVRFDLPVHGAKTVNWRLTAFEDLLSGKRHEEVVGAPFQRLVLNDLFLGEAITSADFDGDGHLDIVAGPQIYFGPDFTRTREIYPARPQGPGAYQNAIMAFAQDWTGNGLPDVLELGLPGESAILYVNPGAQSRTWEPHVVIPSVASESAQLADMDGDGVPELVFARRGEGRSLEFGYAGPNTADPTAPWRFTAIAPPGPWGSHGLGVGDIDADGRPDIASSTGWWRAPHTPGGTWTFHPQDFGFGAQMPIVDINADGRNDVVSIEHAHRWGLGWFEAMPDTGDAPRFTRHTVLGSAAHPDRPRLFSQAHALAVADIDGDGLTDIVSGKRWWAHLQSELDPDPDAPPVLYWFRQVRSADGIRFEPQLLSNRAGVGTQIVARDLTGDGRTDIAVSGRHGTFLFVNTGLPRAHREIAEGDPPHD